nr:hypothetical protein [Archaeoglobus veneficus]
MLQSGVNDALALAQADAGIVIEAGNVAIETVDIILVRNDPRDVVSVIHCIGKRIQRCFRTYCGPPATFAIPLAAGILYGYGTAHTSRRSVADELEHGYSCSECEDAEISG